MIINFNDIISGKEQLSVIGLGYVGLPLAVAFGKKLSVIGFDINGCKIAQYKNFIDKMGENSSEDLRQAQVEYTSNPKILQKARFLIVCVPTPVDKYKKPDLSHLHSANRIIGQNLQKDSVIVYESTVYPGVTEEICVPILEEESGLKCGTDFKVGYSPERINPGDKEHTIEKIIKVVSGQDEETLELIARVYELIVTAGIYKAESIKVAEAAKVIENIQRDINIALMNELSIIFNKIGIDCRSVLRAAGTKWNFSKFYPGLVGGHCIGIDPYYLTFKAEEIGYHPEVILAGRRLNNNMAKYVAENTIKKLIEADKPVKKAKVLILGITFKENCSDIRNSMVANIVKELSEYEVDVYISDPWALEEEVKDEYGFRLTDYSVVSNIDAVIIAVAHDHYKRLTLDEIKGLFDGGMPVLIDIKGIFNRKEASEKGLLYWRL